MDVIIAHPSPELWMSPQKHAHSSKRDAMHLKGNHSG